jgi:carboxyl-terminal processing protease
MRSLFFTIFLTALLALNFSFLQRADRDSIHPHVVVNRPLFDSLLHVVKNYYVDEQRVQSRELLVSTLDQLNLRRDVEVFKQSENHYVVVRNGMRVNVLLNYFMRFEDLADALIEIATLFEGDPEMTVFSSLLSSLDPHSGLLSKDAYQDLRQGTDGKFGGLGVLISVKDQLLTVMKPLPNSPAERAGVLKNDSILSIDGVSTFGRSLDELVQFMRGEPGSQVSLHLLRSGELSPQWYRLEREIIQVETVMAREWNDILHITIESFAANTVDQLKSIIQSHTAQNPQIKGIILDLRSNPGGLLDQAIKVSDLFIDDGVIVATDGRKREVEKARRGVLRADYPIAVLLNRESASASEIVAGALQDHDRAVVIGQPSFGKGSVQTVFEIPGERALKLTIARYFTPMGDSIQQTGIYPDIWVQPIFEREENINLLGEDRFRKESILEHSLGELKSTSIHKSNKLHFKGYSMGQKDLEMDIAALIFDQVASHYPTPLDASALRAQHWLTLSSAKLHKKLHELSSQSAQYLAKKHSLHWSAERSPCDSIHLKTNDVDVASEGQELELEWSIESTCPVVEGLSLFTTSSNGRFTGQEKLLSNLYNKSEGKITLSIPRGVTDRRLPILVGLARDGILMDRVRLQPKIEKREFSELDLSVSLEKSGSSSLVIFPDDSFELRVRVKNTSSFLAEKIAIRLFNLAGQQIEILDSQKMIASLKPAEERTIAFKARSANELKSKILAVGFLVDSPSIASEISQTFTMMSHFDGIKLAH